MHLMKWMPFVPALATWIGAAGTAAVAAPPQLPSAASVKIDTTRLSPEIAARYAAIKPRPEELKWRQIPWIIDLNEGIRVARKEHRPILIWVSGDHPLERC